MNRIGKLNATANASSLTSVSDTDRDVDKNVEADDKLSASPPPSNGAKKCTVGRSRAKATQQGDQMPVKIPSQKKRGVNRKGSVATNSSLAHDDSASGIFEATEAATLDSHNIDSIPAASADSRSSGKSFFLKAKKPAHSTLGTVSGGLASMALFSSQKSVPTVTKLGVIASSNDASPIFQSTQSIAQDFGVFDSPNSLQRGNVNAGNSTATNPNPAAPPSDSSAASAGSGASGVSELTEKPDDSGSSTVSAAMVTNSPDYRVCRIPSDCEPGLH